MTDHVIPTDDYLRSANSVLNAGKRLRDVLDADKPTLEFAVTRLERATQLHETGGQQFRAFMFSELDATAETNKPARERVTEDLLATVLNDFQVANVLMAAGQVLGETGEKAPPDIFNEALGRLENTTHAIERGLGRPLGAGPTPGRFGFTQEAAPGVVQSVDLPSAIEAFRLRSNETLKALVKDAQGVVTNIINALSKLDGSKVLEALSKLGEQVGDLPKIGRLFRQGVEKLQSVADALMRWLGEDLLKRIKGQVEKLWSNIKEGQLVNQALAWAFNVEATQTDIEEILKKDGLRQAAVDDGSNALGKLGVTFKENMKIYDGLASAITLAGTILFFIPAIGSTAALVAIALYVAILAGVLLIGMDYTDSGILKRVRGVREIAQGLA